MSQPPYEPYGNDPQYRPYEPPQSPGGYGQSPYPDTVSGQPAYGGPVVPGPPSGAYPPPSKSNWLAIIGLVLAILALVISWIPLVNFAAIPLAIAGLVLGILTIVKAKNGAGGKGLGIAATVVGGIALLSTIVSLLVYTFVLDAANSSQDEREQNSSQASEEEPSQDAEEEPSQDEEPVEDGETAEASDLSIEFGQFSGTVDADGYAHSSVPVTVTNTSDTSYRFDFLVEALDANGDLLDSCFVGTDTLAPGESVTLETCTLANPDDFEALSSATFEAWAMSKY